MKKLLLIAFTLINTKVTYGFMYFKNHSKHPIKIELDYPDSKGCPDFIMTLAPNSEKEYPAPPASYPKGCKVIQVIFTQMTGAALPNKSISIKGHHENRHFIIDDEKISHNINTKEVFYFK